MTDTPLLSAILDVIARAREPLTHRGVAERASVSPETAATALGRLSEMGLVEVTHATVRSSGKGRPPRLWVPAPAACRPRADAAAAWLRNPVGGVDGRTGA